MCSLKEAAASAVAKEPTSQGKKSAAAAKKEAAAQAKAKALAEKEAAKIAKTEAKKAAAEFFCSSQKMSKFQLKSFYHKSAKQRIQLRICGQRDQSPPPPHQLGQCHRNALRRSTTTS